MLIKIIISFSLFLFVPNFYANGFTKSATTKPQLVQEGPQKEWCPVCGMSIEAYYKTSHTSKINNSQDRQYCSIRCLALDMREYDIKSTDVKVVDVSTEKLIPAVSAFYVVGSDIKGTMSKVSKLAFSSKEAADDFSIENGGEIVDFKTVLMMAQESLSSDIEAMQSKKTKQVYPMGERIFDKRCKKETDINAYLQINELKAVIKEKKLCGELKEGELQALALYLWEVKRFGDLEKIGDTITVTKDEKCPVCGMFAYKYPKWAAQIFYKDTHFSFDGVKDMMKYYFGHKEGISKMLVTDYYSQKAIDATKAFYVIGSDVYGPMGDELIPFAKESEAKTFYMDHKAAKTVSFEDIREKEVYKLDE